MSEVIKEYYRNGNAVEVWISCRASHQEALHPISAEWTRLNASVNSHKFSNELMWFRHHRPQIRRTGCFSGQNDERSYVKLVVSQWLDANTMADPSEFISFLEQNGYREM